ncbi:MAG: ABC transporter ATP-binding protein [Chloroflexota bacterium]
MCSNVNLSSIHLGAPVPALDVSAVAFQFEAGFQLGPVSLRLQTQEMVALLGPNGSGKSTLFRLIAGALRPEQGAIRLAGVPVASLSPRARARQLAVVPQAITIPPGYALREVVAFGRTAHAPMLAGLTNADRIAIDRALALTDTEGLANRQFGTLSGGERQRGLLAMALAQEPKLLLLDEPTAHLDVHYQVDMLDLLHRLHATGELTVLVTLHDLNLAALYFPRLVLLNAGRIVADGDAEAVLCPVVLDPVFQGRISVSRHPTHDVPMVVQQPAPRFAGRDTPRTSTAR